MSKDKLVLELLRPHAEQAYAEELRLLAETDQAPRPAGWQRSPQAVLTYLMGGTLADGQVISPKYFGQKRLMEIAIATLTTDRALLLLGVPGTAKTWVAEHLAAAISGDSGLLVQGTAGLDEQALRYGWNYARLLNQGPSLDALVPSPVFTAMAQGKIVRIEELSRISSEVQDSLLTILSEKTLPIPELNSEIQARQGFNLIATANDRDKGVNELSGALKRRFNTLVLPLPETLEEEITIVKTRVAQQAPKLGLAKVEVGLVELQRLVTLFRELRQGQSLDKKHKIKSPSSSLSTAEIIAVIQQGQALSAHFSNGLLSSRDLAAGILGAVIKDPERDESIFKEYLETIIKERPDWKDWYRAFKDLFGH